MRYRTELMEEILKDPIAQRMIDFVAPIYGESYTALWLFEVIGRAMDGAAGYADSLKAQALPQTATWTLPYWEKEYSTVPESGWTTEQRQDNLLSKIRYVAPANPAKFIMFARAITGGECEIIENVAKNTFLVRLHEYSGATERVRAYLEAAKPAHLLMDLAVDWSAETGVFSERFIFQRLRIPLSFVSYGGKIVRLSGSDALDGSWLLDQSFQSVKLLRTRFTAAIARSGNRISAAARIGSLKARTEHETRLKSAAVIARFAERSELKPQSVHFRSACINNFGGLAGTLTRDSMWRLEGAFALDGSRKLNAGITTETA